MIVAAGLLEQRVSDIFAEALGKFHDETLDVNH
jgi:hypothetical protein